ncbi:MAG: endonuclease/exonuclease/phosphatase family protein [Sterolibacterium sp.]|nr:endonuclease/exonuclease/phosphatase family protein [Sterolibacterium sp.]MBP9800077.1 endonuclease/exonuclease/phosphatase family protein [Sterolibacterium sp.]
MTRTLHVATYNIHKGFSQFNRRMMVHELRERLRELAPDIAFLQEVQGLHLKHAGRLDDWPAQPQHEFLAAAHWDSSAYGRNVLYDHGHHGNAILSRYPILHSHNQDVTHLRFERRGLLHCMIDISGWDSPLHCVCVHLSLLGLSRRRQMDELAAYLDATLPARAPLIIAGDFNDWNNRAGQRLVERLGVHEAFSGMVGQPARSFPSNLPMLRLDRIYIRGFQVTSVNVHHGLPWARISDHAVLSAHLQVDEDRTF